MFPSDRFRLAGATTAELDVLEAEHNLLPDKMRAANEQHFATLDTAGLTQALEVRRGAGLPEIDGDPVHVREETDEDRAAIAADAEQPERDQEDLAAVHALLAPPKPKRSRSQKG